MSSLSLCNNLHFKKGITQLCAIRYICSTWSKFHIYQFIQFVWLIVKGIVSPGDIAIYMMKWITFQVVWRLAYQDLSFKNWLMFKIHVLVVIKILLLCQITVTEKWFLCLIHVTQEGSCFMRNLLIV